LNIANADARNLIYAVLEAKFADDQTWKPGTIDSKGFHQSLQRHDKHFGTQKKATDQNNLTSP
jgi:hypothetical protein